MTPTVDAKPRETLSPAKAERFVENIAGWRTSEVLVDRRAGTIANIVLVGPDSRNGYRYKPEALREAVALYDGKIVFLDHATDPARPRQRSTRDVAGTLVRPRFVDGKLRGDIAVVDTEAGRTLLALAESDRPGVGMSHVVLARRSEDGSVVEKIHDVVSVDAVVFPATSTSFREQQHGDANDAASQSQASSASPPTPGAADQLATDLATAEDDRGTDDPAGQTTLAAGLAQLADGLEHLLEQIVALIDERDQLRGEAERRRADEDRRGRRAWVERLVEEARLPSDAASDLFLDLLATCDDEAQVRALIEDRRHLTELTRRAAPKSRERNGDNGASRDPSAALIEAITGRSAASSPRLLSSRV
jgi:hypothetical protein